MQTPSSGLPWSLRRTKQAFQLNPGFVKADTAMTPDESERAFRAFIARRGLELQRLSVTQAVPLATDFYAAQRVAGASRADDEDMLLFQWGTSTIDGYEGFQFDLTRQFVWASRLARFVRLRLLGWQPADAATMSHLHLTLFFEPVAELAELGTGNHWCRRPEDALRFRELIVSSAPYERLASAGLTPRVELRFERV